MSVDPIPSSAPCAAAAEALTSPLQYPPQNTPSTASVTCNQCRLRHFTPLDK